MQPYERFYAETCRSKLFSIAIGDALDLREEASQRANRRELGPGVWIEGGTAGRRMDVIFFANAEWRFG